MGAMNWIAAFHIFMEFSSPLSLRSLHIIMLSLNLVYMRFCDNMKLIAEKLCHQKRMRKRRVMSNSMLNLLNVSWDLRMIFVENIYSASHTQSKMSRFQWNQVHGMSSLLWGRQNCPMVNLSFLTMRPTPLLCSLSKPGFALAYSFHQVKKKKT